MEEKKYLNEEEYNTNIKKVSKILLNVGLILFVVSIVLKVINTINFGNNVLNENEKGVLGGIGLFA